MLNRVKLDVKPITSHDIWKAIKYELQLLSVIKIAFEIYQDILKSEIVLKR